MKVLLFAVNGSYSHTNLAIRCLRGPLEAAGFEVVLLERNLRDRQTSVFADLMAENADIVGFSTYIWNFSLMLEYAQDLKTVRPECRVIFGGPEVSFDTERFEGMSFIDAIVCGEGEKAMPELCRAMRDGKAWPRIVHGQPSEDVMKDEGILYREHDFPSGSIIYYESSRGCPYSCAYCLSSVEQGVRAKSVEQTLKDLREFEKLPDKIRIIKFVDRTFNYDVHRANAIWRALLSPEFTRHYHFELCASLLNEESYAILAQFPKDKVQLEIGLQSTFEPTLKAVSRHIQAQAVLEKVRRIKEMPNVHVHLDLIAGLPYESYDRFRQSFDEAYGCCDLLQLGFLKLLHGTELRQRAEEYGIRFRSKAPYTVLQTRWLSYEEIARLDEIAEVMERYRDSGRFERCLSYAVGQLPSPFAFFEGMAESLKGIRLQSVSQVNAYQYLYRYASTLLSEEQMEVFSAKMHEDFTVSETKRVPDFLRSHVPQESDLKPVSLNQHDGSPI